MLTTATLHEILRELSPKQEITLPKLDSAKSFWGEMWSLFSMIRYYNPKSKKWEYQDFDRDCIEWKSYCENAEFPTYNLQDLALAFGNYDSLELVNKDGKLLKRFNKFVKRHNKVDIDSATLGVIGDKLQQFISKNQTVVFDFHDSIDWEDGQFGHSGSCWWNEYADSRPTFENAGGWAIRFYSDMEDREGIGRTWILPYENALVCFNSYGIERGQVIQLLKYLFASRKGIELSHTIVRNITNINNDRIPYINGGTGFVLAEPGHEYFKYVQIQDSTLYLDLEVIEDPSGYHCDSCGVRVHEDYAYSDDYGNIYCESCYDDRYTYCESCDSIVDRDEIVRVYGHSQYNYACRHCAHNRLGAAECSGCDEFHTEYIITDDTESVFCSYCARIETFYCENCGKYLENSTECESCQKESTAIQLELGI